MKRIDFDDISLCFLGGAAGVLEEFRGPSSVRSPGLSFHLGGPLGASRGAEGRRHRADSGHEPALRADFGGATAREAEDAGGRSLSSTFLNLLKIS